MIDRIPVVLSVLLFFLFGIAPSNAGEAGKQPLNVLVISVDTLRADHLGCYGYFRQTSPIIDALAAESVFFELALSPLTATLPAHTSLLTGLHPLEHGILANVKQGGKRFVRTPAVRSFAEFATEHGYRTAAFVSAAPVSRATGVDTGFAAFDDPQGKQRRADATNERVFQWLETVDRSRPLFVWIHYFDPHSPYNAPEPFGRMYGKDEALEAHLRKLRIADTVERPNTRSIDTRKAINAYDGEIRYVDQEIGKLFDRLRRLDLWEDTLTVLLSDHGEGLGEHGMAGHGYIHREQLHVPLMMRIPGRAPQRISTPVSLVDVLPTVVGQLGAASWSAFLEQASGRDLLSSEPASLPVLSRRSERVRDDLGGPAFSLATERWKYVHEPETTDRLFHWAVDPGELEDVRQAQLPLAERMKRQLLDQVAGYEARKQKLQGPTAAEEETMDPELLEKLRALGYVD